MQVAKGAGMLMCAPVTSTFLFFGLQHAKHLPCLHKGLLLGKMVFDDRHIATLKRAQMHTHVHASKTQTHRR